MPLLVSTAHPKGAPRLLPLLEGLDIFFCHPYRHSWHALLWSVSNHSYYYLLYSFFFNFFPLRQCSFLALEPALELALIDQAGLKLTELHLPLPPECWN